MADGGSLAFKLLKRKAEDLEKLNVFFPFPVVSCLAWFVKAPRSRRVRFVAAADEVCLVLHPLPFQIKYIILGRKIAHAFAVVQKSFGGLTRFVAAL